MLPSCGAACRGGALLRALVPVSSEQRAEQSSAPTGCPYAFSYKGKAAPYKKKVPLRGTFLLSFAVLRGLALLRVFGVLRGLVRLVLLAHDVPPAALTRLSSCSTCSMGRGL